MLSPPNLKYVFLEQSPGEACVPTRVSVNLAVADPLSGCLFGSGGRQKIKGVTERRLTKARPATKIYQ